MTALFTVEELDQIKAEAKVEAAKIIKEQLIQQALGQSATTDAVLDDSEPKEKDWVVEPIPDPQEEFAETSIYGISLRVNRTGTRVQILTGGKWVDRAIYYYDESKNAVPVVYLANKCCPSSRGKGGSVSFRLTHLVKMAFDELPKYIADVLYTRRGPSIIFGLRLCRQINGDVNDCRLENIEWIPESRFERAVFFKKQRLGILDEA